MSELTAKFLRFRGEPGIAELSADEALDRDDWRCGVNCTSRRRRNGWEIVKERSQYALRHPVTREEVYIGRLTRVRQVADESRPE